MVKPFQMLVMTTAFAVAMTLLAPVADAHHRPSLYCSESGDLCQSTRKVDGVRKLGLLLAAKYFRVFHVCVTDPGGYESCVPFRVRSHDDGTFGRDVRWRRHFPYGGRGAYTVSWWVGDQRIGRVLGFHIR